MTPVVSAVIRVSHSADLNERGLAELTQVHDLPERRLYTMGRFSAAPGIRTRNMEGLSEDWLALRNAALAGTGQGRRVVHDPDGYFANGCVAIALRDFMGERDSSVGSLWIAGVGRPVVRLDAPQLDRARLVAMVRAYISGDVWRLSGFDWALVLAALPPPLIPAL